jgi:hypothetical protein
MKPKGTEPTNQRKDGSVVRNESDKWQSNAEWNPCYEFENNVTTDTHQTKEQAEAVCRGLMREGLGCGRIHFPVRVWVSVKESEQDHAES